MRLTLLLIVFALAIASCAPMQEGTSEPGVLPPDTAVTHPPFDGTPEEPAPDPYAPQPGDPALVRGNVFIQEMNLLIRESFPPQIALTLQGELPTPCHQLRVQAGEPDADNRIYVEVYSVVNPDLACIQVVEPFEANIDLGTYPSGHYSVWVNGELAGEFDS
jgi:hypothetical protein